MKTAREHPDTAEVAFPLVLARIACAFAVATILVPALAAAVRAVLL